MWFFLLVTMTWQGWLTTTYVGPFPSHAACVAMREGTAERLVTQQWIAVGTMEPCQRQEAPHGYQRD
jgi:hypothetical protein